MSKSSEEHYRYVEELEMKNEELLAQVVSRETAILSLKDENESLRRSLDRACRSADGNARELDQLRSFWRVIHASSTEIRSALGTVSNQPQKPLAGSPSEEGAEVLPHNAFAPRHRARSTEPAR